MTREHLKNKRKQAEAEKAAKEKQSKIIKLVGVAFLIVVFAIGAVFAGVYFSSSDESKTASNTEIAKLLNGIPQNGTVIGNPDAPVTLVEYADLRCRFCAELSNNALKDVIDTLVRDGKLKIEFRPWAIIQGSADVSRGMYAAANQNKAWNYVEEFYKTQEESPEPLSPEQAKAKAKEVAKRAGVPDMSKWEKDYSDPNFDQEMLEVSDQAEIDLNLTGTPAFAILKNGKLIKTNLNATSSVADFEKIVKDNR
jgi:protein-disulfide isomerase